MAFAAIDSIPTRGMLLPRGPLRSVRLREAPEASFVWPSTRTANLHDPTGEVSTT